jgi:hypothetical protein
MSCSQREGAAINAKKQEPGYFAFIPASVLYDKKIPANAKLLYGTIASLCNKKGYCWAGNAYLAQLYDTSERTIANLITALRNAGHISVEYSYIPGKREIEGRFITLTCIRETQEDAAPEPARDTQTPPPDAGSDEDAEGVKKSSPRGEKNCTTYGKKFQEVVKIFSKGDEKNFRGINININNKATTAAGPPASGADPPPEAAAAIFSPEELKDALAEIDAALVFDRDFYPRAAAFMAANGLERPYLSWLLRQCELKNPRSLDGLYYTLFFADNMAEKFKAIRQAAAPPQIACPVCGLSHDEYDGQCPQCGLSRGASPALIHNEREVFNLPPDKRAAYLERETAIADECGSDFIKANHLFAALRLEFGLSWLS